MNTICVSCTIFAFFPFIFYTSLLDINQQDFSVVSNRLNFTHFFQNVSCKTTNHAIIESIAIKTRKPCIEAGIRRNATCYIALEMKYRRLRYSHSLAEAVVLQKQFTTALSSCCAYQSNVI